MRLTPMRCRSTCEWRIGRLLQLDPKSQDTNPYSCPTIVTVRGAWQSLLRLQLHLGVYACILRINNWPYREVILKFRKHPRSANSFSQKGVVHWGIYTSNLLQCTITQSPWIFQDYTYNSAWPIRWMSMSLQSKRTLSQKQKHRQTWKTCLVLKSRSGMLWHCGHGI